MNHVRSQSKASSHHFLDLSEKLFRIVSYGREHPSTKPCQCPLVWLQIIVSLGPLLCGVYSCWSLALWSLQLLVPCFVEFTAAGPLLCGVYSCWSFDFFLEHVEVHHGHGRKLFLAQRTLSWSRLWNHLFKDLLNSLFA